MTPTANLADLGELIESHQDELLSSWQAEVALLPGAENLDGPTIIDHIPQLLTELSENLKSDRSEANLILSPAEHGVQRWRVGFDITEVVAEYGILRTCLYRLAERNNFPLTNQAARVVNTVFDNAVAQAIKAYATHMTVELQKRREEHFSFVIHDLRTPLQAISLATTLLERSLSAESKIELFEASLSTLRRNISRLDALIKRVLQDEANLHLTNSSKIEKREFDLWSLVESSIRDLHPIATDSHTTLFNDVPSDMTIFADARLLGQVFQNLLSNAIKFTPNGKIIVGARQRDDDGIVQCWVRDTGAGIESERLDKIFEKLETDHQPEKRGVGLGLAIVKQIIEHHGGTITVESRVGEGSTFTFTIR
ncbi:MAG TPA: sensor histidine kinase [Pyrinomonadaceae bacterium]|jgi:two-component system, OmpR family, phosphate regulon sensor histidine kinase PhoR|nr:sensor histidine kinase [Pyrinomonadaceae bacterium]